MGKGPSCKTHVCTLAALAVTAGLLGGCAGSPFGQRPSLTEAQAAYQRQDYWTAAQMLRPLAYEGNAEAQYALGYLYYYGRGVKRNRGFAMSWFGEAVRLGHEKAREALAAVQSEARLTLQPGSARPARDDSLRSEPVTPPAGGASTAPERTRAAVCGDTPATEAAEAQAQLPGASAGGEGPVPTEPAKGPAVEPPAAETGPGPRAPQSPARGSQLALARHERPEPPAAAPAGPSEPPARSGARARQPEAAAAYPRFTLQLIGSRSRDDLERLVERFGLEEVSYIEDERQGAPWYRLIYRGFDSLAEARRALQALAPALQRHRPFVRNFPAVQMAALKRAH